MHSVYYCRHSIKTLIATIIITLSSCNLFIDTKFVRQKLNHGNVTVRWYFFSYLTKTSPDIVELERDGKIRKVYEGNAEIVGVKMTLDTITIRVVRDRVRDFKLLPPNNEAFGYHIALDSTADPIEINFIPQAIGKD